MKKRKEKKYKIRRVALRLTEDDYAKMRASADRLTSGNMTKLILSAVLDRPLRVIEENEADRRVLDHVKKIMAVYRNIGINYNQVVKRLNTIRVSAEVVRELSELTEKTEKLIRLTSALNELFEKMQPYGSQDQ